MKAKSPVPESLEAWLVEIAGAYRDAAEAIPFGPVVGARLGEGELFHIAPSVALKLRGLPRSRRQLSRASEAALASYIANRDVDPEVFANPHLSFAFCYLASHHGLGLLGEAQTEKVMDYVERHRRSLARLIAGDTKPNRPRQSAASARLSKLRSSPESVTGPVRMRVLK
jgi:hypothetical protein